MNTPRLSNKRYLLLAPFFALVLLVGAPAWALDSVNTTFFGVAIKGYDTVAYHLEDRAVKGSKKCSSSNTTCRQRF